MSKNCSFAPLSLEHQSVLSKVWKDLCLKHDLQFSEYSFANNFLFRRQHNYAFVDCKHPCVRGAFKHDHFYYVPTCSPEHFKLESFTDSEQSICLFPIPEKWLQEIDKYHPTIKSSRSESDYMFTSDKIQTFPGRALSSRRNLLSQLINHHEMESRELSDNEIAPALGILESWQEHSDQSKEASDYWPGREALELLKRLDLFGRIAYADGEPIGFTIGELLTPTTALLHFAKANHNYKGITPYLYQDFAKHLPDSVQWINMEQDLGLPSLRKAKEAYDPDQLLTKWHVTIGGK